MEVSGLETDTNENENVDCNDEENNLNINEMTQDAKTGLDDVSQESWRALIKERVEVLAAKKKQRQFLYLGGFALGLGVLLAVTGFILGWEKGRKFPLIIGGYCAALATLLSIFQVMEHLAGFSDPEIQSRIVRILFMVPIYAITSWLAIAYSSYAVYFDLVRDMYESYAIYTFFSLMIGLLGGLDECVRYFMINGHIGDGLPHPWPFCCLKNWFMVPAVLYRITLSILQFMVLKPLCTVIVIILSIADVYGSSFTDFGNSFIYITFIYNISITVAFSALIYFYIATKDLLKDHDPLLKFTCIKGVIFLSYWQALAIAIMDATGLLPRVPFWEQGEETRIGLQDFLICCEMLIFAIVHKYVFGAKEYTQGLQVGARIVRGAVLPTAKQGIWTNLKRTLQHDDVAADFAATWSFIRAF